MFHQAGLKPTHSETTRSQPAGLETLCSGPAPELGAKEQELKLPLSARTTLGCILTSMYTPEPLGHLPWAPPVPKLCWHSGVADNYLCKVLLLFGQMQALRPFGPECTSGTKQPSREQQAEPRVDFVCLEVVTSFANCFAPSLAW